MTRDERGAEPLIWPAHTAETRAWSQLRRAGTRDDRMLSEVTVMLPPEISRHRLPAVPSDLIALCEDAVREIARLDELHGDHLDALATLLLRTESVASSKIEREEASTDDFARALHGNRSNRSATSMAASAAALDLMIRSVGPGRDITRTAVLAAHRSLMVDDPTEATYAGRLRDMQNWIGGSDHSPRNALFVPPPPELVGSYTADLIRFANRDDVPVMVQAAVAHAQFESIHPFTDGNGRIGRALINTILRRRSTTRRVVVPLASALVAKREVYFATLDSYRSGDAGPVVASFALASTIAATESAVTAERLRTLPAQWMERARQPRRASAPRKIIESLLGSPIFTAASIEATTGASTPATYEAIRRLEEAEIIRPLTNRNRGQVWGAADLLDELDDLGVRIGATALTRQWPTGAQL